MSFKKLENDDEEVFDYCGICPECRSPMTFTHDLKCDVCDFKKIMFCPGCQLHYELKL